MIAAALTLTFLIPVVLLSSVIGVPTSRRSTVRTLRELVAGVEAVRHRQELPRPEGSLPEDLETLLLARRIPFVECTRDDNGNSTSVPSEAPAPFPTEFDQKRDTKYHEFHFHGSKDTYRPWKMRTFNNPGWEVCLASLPVLAGLVAGLWLLMLAGEAGFSCRHVLLLSILGAWLLSALLTSLLYLPLLHHPKLSRKWHWRLCLFKGLLVGVGVLVFVELTAAGFFNTCSCWGRKLIRGEETVVFLSVLAIYLENNKWKFPAIVAGVVFFQLVFSVLVLWANADGVRVLRWSERRREAAWLAEEVPLGRRERMLGSWRRVRFRGWRSERRHGRSLDDETEEGKSSGLSGGDDTPEN